MDGITLFCIKSELEAHVGSRVEKIYQSERDELLLHLRSGKLLLSAHPVNARVQLTTAKRENPAHPPMFCMLLRKHLVGGRIASLEQPLLDRVLRIGIEARDELGELANFTLVAEIMGRHSNLVLLNEGGTVLGAARHITPGISSVRVIMPGVPYSPPPPQGKVDPRTANRGDVIAALSHGARADRALLAAFSGLSPQLAQEAAARAGLEGEFAALPPDDKLAAAERVLGFFSRIRERDFAPTVIRDNAALPIATLPFESALYDDAFQTRYDSMSAALDDYYEQRDRAELLKRKSASLLKILHNNIERCHKKLALQQDALLGAEKAETQRLFGDLLTANLYRLKRGMREATLEDYTSGGALVRIPLDDTLSPADNAQRYYKRYNKAKAAAVAAAQQIELGREELAYLEGQEQNVLSSTTTAELAEIREELTREGYVKPERTRGKAPKVPPSKPLHYRSSDGQDIFVGKNNAQNDRLTLKTAAPTDTWLHAKDIPGSHVILTGTASETALREAAMLAALHSKARASSNVPVDYTLARYVKKPAGARPGNVIFTHNATLYVTPDEAAAKALGPLD